MTDSETKIDINLFQLVLSLQVAAMQQMGKIVSPLSGKIERNLEQAKISIALLEMLADKTRGNLNSEEDSFLKNILFELRMNFLDESRKPESQPETDKGQDKSDIPPGS